ncbi:MAG: pentapeptide repeat-containing protein [Chromatiales bacterium]|nr:pentapeptide repeat-containing protein [Chromatiales bacterium]
MWKPNLKRRRYKILGGASFLFTVMVLLIVTIGGEIIFMDSTIAKNQTILFDKNADITDRIEALRYLASKRVSLANSNFAGEQELWRALDISPEALEIKKGLDLKNVNFAGADLSGINLSEADLSGANLSNANLSDARLHNVDLSNANLTGAELYKANLSGANLSKARLLGANLFGTRLTGANLTDANLSNANLFAVSLTSANLSNVIFSRRTVIDSTWVWKTIPGQEPTAYLPIGTPKNWNTTLKPTYRCSEKVSLITEHDNKKKIKARMAKKCNAYQPAEVS